MQCFALLSPVFSSLSLCPSLYLSMAVPWLRRSVAGFFTSHRRALGSISDQSIWDLWWVNWHVDKFFFEFFGFHLAVLIPT
jgi:hypothetical protein